MLRYLKKTNTISQSIQSSFAVKTTQAVYLKVQKPSTSKYSREMIQNLNTDPLYYKKINNIQLVQREQLLNQKIYSLQQNDKNPANYIKLKITQNQEKQFNPQIPQILVKQPREKKVTCFGIRGRIQSSMKKLLIPATMIKKMHIFDALAFLQVSPTKASKEIYKAVQQTRDHAKQKQMDDQRLWISEVQVNKSRRFKGLRYHAKSKMGREITDIMKVKIILGINFNSEEKPVQELYKKLLVGKAPPMLAYVLRNQMITQKFNLSSDKDYDELQKYNYILTSKGRQQRRLMFKRRVLAKHLELKVFSLSQKNGAVVPMKVIANKILNEESYSFAQQYEKSRADTDQKKLESRLELFKKNEDITG